MRVCAGILCSTHTAEVTMPSVPSFWMPGRPERNLSVTSLPRPGLAEPPAGNFQNFLAEEVLPSASVALEAEARTCIVDLAEVVVEALDFSQ